MNKELLLKVRNRINRHADQFCMETWIESSENKCGTVACIAGWTVLLGDRDLSRKHRLISERAAELISERAAELMHDEHLIFFKAQDLLQLSDEQADLLFFTHHWPEPFITEYVHTVIGKKGSGHCPSANRPLHQNGRT